MRNDRTSRFTFYSSPKFPMELEEVFFVESPTFPNLLTYI